MKIKAIKTTVALILLFAILLCFTAVAVGEPVYTNTRLLADNLEYINTVSWDSELGRTESFAIRMNGPGDAYPIVMNGDTIFGGFGITRMVSYAESLGKNVLAAVNTDFFTQSMVPIGIVIEEGIYKSSPGSRNAVTFGYDGSVSIVESPTVWINLRNNGGAQGSNNAGQTISMRNFNKTRTDTGGLVLYSEAFSTVSTRASTPGWYVRFRILEGTPSVSGTMSLEVTEAASTEGAVPIGEGYLVLTAADQSNIRAQFEKFAVGDKVTLTTTCTDDRLEGAQYATGGGDILVADGEITDSEGWSQTLMPRAPRTAFGLREDGSVVSYVIDGRNNSHSIGLTLSELAEEMKQQGCIYAVNFDGGGSTALSVRLPGDNSALVANRPSDGAERACATYILFVTDAVSDGEARHLSLINNGAVVLAGSKVDLKYTATDSAYMPVAIPDDIEFYTMDQYDYDGEAVYTAGNSAEVERLSLYSPSTGAFGIGEIYVITRPTSITASIKGTTAPLTSVRLAPGAALELAISATYYTHPVTAQLDSFTYSVSGDIGEMTEPGVFTAGLIANQSGSISISAGGRRIVIAVEISGFEDMENHWAREYAEYLLQAGITKGVSETLYGPSQLMRRGDFILMLYRAAGEPETSVAFIYADVLPEMYYAQALTWANRVGIAQEPVGSDFYPQMPLTRQDAMTFTYRALDLLGKEYTDGTREDLERFFDLESLDEYAVIPAATLVKLEIIDGISGSIAPHSTLTRAQMAKILALALQLN